MKKKIKTMSLFMLILMVLSTFLYGCKKELPPEDVIEEEEERYETYLNFVGYYLDIYTYADNAYVRKYTYENNPYKITYETVGESPMKVLKTSDIFTMTRTQFDYNNGESRLLSTNYVDLDEITEDLYIIETVVVKENDELKHIKRNNTYIQLSNTLSEFQLQAIFKISEKEYLAFNIGFSRNRI
jgi:hypothetical protein